MIKKLIHRFTFNQLAIAFVVLAALLGVQQVLLGNINNYLMFSRPFFNLLEGKNIYIATPEDYLDIYKYSPAFAILFSPLSILPDAVGIVLWNMLNAAVLMIAFKQFFKTDAFAIYALLIVLLEAITSLQNLQSNCLLSGLIILTYTQLRDHKYVVAALAMAVAAFIKIYGIGVLSLAVFFKEKFKFGFTGLFFLLVLFLLPFVFINYDQFILNYKTWMEVVNVSATGSQMSVMGIMKTWFGWNESFRTVQLTGLAILLAPLLQLKLYSHTYFRQLFLASILMFVVLFNQMAESPTYIIPLAGVAIWFLSLKKPSALDISLLVFVILLTSLSTTDLFPRPIREQYIRPYTLKALPVLLVWIRLQWQLWTLKDETRFNAFITENEM